jgi:biopolymer transport protein ExbD
MAMTGGSSKGIKNEINVTPLVDVVLVLLIIFMVITPMLQRGKDVHLPKANNPEKDQKEGDPLIVSVTPDRKIWIEANSVTEESFESKIVPFLDKDPTRKMLLKGDEALVVGDVRKVMDHLKKAGAKGVELAVESTQK